jgi:hypothetical protein
MSQSLTAKQQRQRSVYDTLPDWHGGKPRTRRLWLVSESKLRKLMQLSLPRQPRMASDAE